MKIAYGAVMLVLVCHTAALALATKEEWAQYNERYATDPAIKKWIEDLRQPNSSVRCCGEADAYWADSFEVQGDEYVATITDERDDVPNRPIVKPGTKILVPKDRQKFDEGNPTGHGIIFLDSEGRVLCYVAPGGV